MVAVKRTTAQRRKPHVVGVGAQLGAEMRLRRIPNFFSRKLHLYSVKKSVFKVFYSPSRKTVAWRSFSQMLISAKNCSLREDTTNSTLLPNFSLKIKIRT